MASVQAAATDGPSGARSKSARRDTLQPPKSIADRLLDEVVRTNGEPGLTPNGPRDGAGRALTDTPLSTAPSSPQMYVWFRASDELRSPAASAVVTGWSCCADEARFFGWAVPPWSREMASAWQRHALMLFVVLHGGTPDRRPPAFGPRRSTCQA